MLSLNLAEDFARQTYRKYIKNHKNMFYSRVVGSCQGLESTFRARLNDWSASKLAA